MISRERWNQLRAGDVILISGRMRLVVSGPADRPETGRRKHINCGCEFAILNRSWTGRPTTCQLWSDVHKRASVLRKTVNVRRFAIQEMQRLISCGWPLSRLVTEAAEAVVYGRRIGRSDVGAEKWLKCLQMRLQSSKKCRKSRRESVAHV